MGLFGKSKQQQAEEVGRHAGMFANSTLRPLMHGKMLLKAVNADPFVAGYVQAKLMEVVLVQASGKTFGPDEMNMAGLVALQQIFGADAMAAGLDIRRHSTEKSPEFVRGRQRAVDVLRYQMGQRAVSSDSMYAEAKTRALELCKLANLSLGTSQATPGEEDVIVALEAIELGDRVVAKS